MKVYLLKDKVGSVVSICVCNNDNLPSDQLTTQLALQGYQLVKVPFDRLITSDDWEEVIKDQIYFHELEEPVEEPEKH